MTRRRLTLFASILISCTSHDNGVVPSPLTMDDACCSREQARRDATLSVDASIDPMVGQMTSTDTGNERPDSSFMDTGGLSDGSADSSHSSACRGIICGPGEVCQESTGRCRERSFGQPGGPCDDNESCVLGQCRSFGMTAPLCWRSCEDDSDCPQSICAQTIFGMGCMPRCSNRDRCSGGRICEPRYSGASQSVCVPDCREAGCVGQLGCDDETGRCQPADFPCLPECQVGESCTQGRCLRVTGSCETNFHCLTDRICHRGRCVMGAGINCSENTDCDPGHACIFEALSIPNCQNRCTRQAECPPGHFCDAQTETCRLSVCGSDGGSALLHGECDERLHGVEGTCIPFDGDGPDGYQAPGYCLERGDAALGEPCDAQSQGRSPEHRASQCEIGSVCYGDPDRLGPEVDPGGRGTCRAVCHAGQPDCGSDTCVRIGPFDDPATEENENYPLSLCLPVTCSVLESCGPDSICRPYGFWSVFGTCRAQGDASAGEACQTDTDCRGQSICIGRPNGSRCLALCGPHGTLCPQGTRCFMDYGWAFGVCI